MTPLLTSLRITPNSLGWVTGHANCVSRAAVAALDDEYAGYGARLVDYEFELLA